MAGVSEKLRRIFNKHHIPVHFKPSNTLRQKLVHPKHRTPRHKLKNVVYAVQCSEECIDLYIGETKQLLHKCKGHTFEDSNVRILAREAPPPLQVTLMIHTMEGRAHESHAPQENMDYLPDDNSRYKDVDYWDERYKTEQCYDWLGDFSKFQHLLEKHVKKEDSILILGCGNSSMSGDMYNAGYHSITNIDYSSVCISTMSARHSNCPGMTWHEMDIRQLSFPDASFDVVLEKATLDAIMVEEKTPWEVSPQTACFIHKSLTEISRCLKPGGRFVSITFANPFFRKRLYARTEYNWSIKKYSYGEGFEYFVYVMTKGEELSPEDAALEKKLLEETKSPPVRVATTHSEAEEEFLSNIDL